MRLLEEIGQGRGTARVGSWRQMSGGFGNTLAAVRVKERDFRLGFWIKVKLGDGLYRERYLVIG